MLKIVRIESLKGEGGGLRIFVKIFAGEGTRQFPADYRRFFMSLIKSAFTETPFEDIVTSHERLPKPYTFSVGFHNLKSVNAEIVEYEGPMYFNFSSPIPQMVGYLYNYLRGDPSGFFKGASLDMELPPHEVIKSRVVSFKILGSAVLTRANFESYFVKPEDPDFEEALNHSLKVRIEHLKELLREFGLREPSFSPVAVVEKNLKPVVVKHYDGFVNAFTGTITLQGEPDVLNFIRDCGLGVRTGQGFGMVRVVKQWT